jgi:hypothetical protein
MSLTKWLRIISARVVNNDKLTVRNNNHFWVLLRDNLQVSSEAARYDVVNKHWLVFMTVSLTFRL